MTMSMRVLTLLPVLLSLISCIPVQREYYLPSNGEDSYETKSCGFVPGGGYSKEIASGARLVVKGTANDGDLWLHFQFIVTEGHTLKFESNRVQVSAGVSISKDVFINYTSGGEYPSLNPMEPMTGGTKQLYVANLEIPNFSHNEFTLIMPPANVDAQRYKIKPISFYFVSKKGVMACIQ